MLLMIGEKFLRKRHLFWFVGDFGSNTYLFGMGEESGN